MSFSWKRLKYLINEAEYLFNILRVFRVETWLTVYCPLDKQKNCWGTPGVEGPATIGDLDLRKLAVEEKSGITLPEHSGGV